MDYISVRVGEVPGSITEVMLNGDRTVEAALEAAGLSIGNREAKVDGDPATLDTRLSDGSTVLLVKKIKGAR